MLNDQVVTRELPGRYLKIGGVQGITYLYLLSECCVPLEDGSEQEHVIPFTELEMIPSFIYELKSIASALFENDPDTAELETRAASLREKLKEFATDIYAYQDILKLHEYVLARTKPVDAPAGQTVNDEAEARDILTAVFKAGTNAAINENISAVISQLPLRMTKARYHDILDNELKVYADGPKSAFDRNLFLMKMSAGISDWPHFGIARVENCLEMIKYPEDIDSASKAKLEEELRKCMELLDDYRDVLELTVQSLDCLMVYMKNYNDAGKDEIDFVLELKNIVDESLENLEKGSRRKMSDRVMGLFSKTEGIVDTEFEKITQNLSRFLKGSTPEPDRELKPYFDRFLICDRLLSQSYYADIDDTGETEEEPMGIPAVEKEVDEFCGILFEKTSAESKMLARARMAATFTNVPVFFTSRTEVMNYVLGSIGGCRDQYEKEVSIKLARNMIV
ncbi:MAG: hypothetical protein K6E62_14065 [Lachnospiraceae bacterium]|nr:hypothetical protein [Lachnospiraceae bacterium]